MLRCTDCGEEAKIPCHKLNGKVLCFDCNKKNWKEKNEGNKK